MGVRERVKYDSNRKGDKRERVKEKEKKIERVANEQREGVDGIISKLLDEKHSTSVWV